MHFADATIDLHHLGRAEAVACRLLDTSAGPVLVDPGPASTLDTLHAQLAARGVAPHDLHALLLTHIHFDHAGASGVLAQAHPGLTVYVHPAGAPHLADPRRLVASATRIYGDAMDRLWGPILPVPEGQLRLLDDESRLTLGDRALAVRHTPGHAVHHAAFLDEGTGIAYVGDTAGIRSPAAPVALPVTPPPDFDLEAWLGSLERLAGWSPTQLFITHFGIIDTPQSHFEAIREGLADRKASKDADEDEDSDDLAVEMLAASTEAVAVEAAPAEVVAEVEVSAGDETATNTETESND